MKEEINLLIDKYEEEIVDFTGQLIKTPSENPPGDEESVANVIIEKMKNLDITEIEKLEKEKGRPNVLAWVRGRRDRPLLMLNAHIDTKPVGEEKEWRVDPFSAEIIDGEMYGRGTCDMKAAAAAMIMAAGLIKKVKAQLNGSLLLAMTADEEAGGSFGVEWLILERGLKADAAIVGEPSGIDTSFEFLNLASRGVFCFDLDVHGTQMHSSLSDLKGGINASVKLSNILSRMQSELKLAYEPHPLYPQGVTINPGVFINGGVYYGVVPGLCTAGNDIRILPGMLKEQIIKDVDSFLDMLKGEDPELKVQAKPRVFVEPMEISSEEPIVQACIEAYQNVFGYKPKIGGYPAGVDARFMVNQGKFPAVPAFGPGLLPISHGPNERVPVIDIIRATKVYALAALEYLSVNDSG